MKESNIKYKKTILSLKFYLEKLNVSDGAATGEAPVPIEDSRSISSHLREQKNSISFISQGPALGASILSTDVGNLGNIE